MFQTVRSSSIARLVFQWRTLCNISTLFRSAVLTHFCVQWSKTKNSIQNIDQGVVRVDESLSWHGKTTGRNIQLEFDSWWQNLDIFFLCQFSADFVSIKYCSTLQVVGLLRKTIWATLAQEEQSWPLSSLYQFSTESSATYLTHSLEKQS